MRKLLITGPREILIVEEPDEPLIETAIRIRSLYNGISHGTEMNFYRGTAPEVTHSIEDGLFVKRPQAGASYPIWHGYETVGEVVEVGKNARGFRVGDVVWAGTQHADVVTCDTTEENRPFFCERMPEGGNPQAGIFLALAGVALDGYLTSGLMHGETALVSGLGCIGLLTVQILRNAGIRRIIATDPMEKRRQFAADFGAHVVIDPTKVDLAEYVLAEVTAGKGLDAAIETSGNWKALHDAIRCCASGYGRVVALGFYQGQGTALRLGEEFHHSSFFNLGASSILAINNRREPAQGRAWDKVRVYHTLAEMLADGTLQTEKLLSRVYPFEKAAEAFEHIDKAPEDVIKVALQF